MDDIWRDDKISILSEAIMKIPRFFRKKSVTDDDLPVVIDGQLVEKETTPQTQDNSLVDGQEEQDYTTKRIDVETAAPEQKTAVSAVTKNDEDVPRRVSTKQETPHRGVSTVVNNVEEVATPEDYSTPQILDSGVSSNSH